MRPTGRGRAARTSGACRVQRALKLSGLLVATSVACANGVPTRCEIPDPPIPMDGYPEALACMIDARSASDGRCIARQVASPASAGACDFGAQCDVEPVLDFAIRATQYFEFNLSPWLD